MIGNDTIASLAVNSWINGRVVWPEAYLSGANLRGANLRGAYLSEAYLSGVEIAVGNRTFRLTDGAAQ